MNEMCAMVPIMLFAIFISVTILAYIISEMGSVDVPIVAKLWLLLFAALVCASCAGLFITYGLH